MFINLTFLKNVTIHPYVDQRFRYEQRDNLGFLSPSSGTRDDMFSRTRLGAKFVAQEGWSGELQYQFADDRYSTRSLSADPHNSDMRLAYFGRKYRGSSFEVGRLPLTVGNQRLIGTLEWVNTARSFDGVVAHLRSLEFFAVRIGTAVPLPGNARLLGLVQYRKNEYFGLYQKFDSSPIGETSITTLNFNGHWKTNQLAYETEAAVQFGTEAGKNQSAFALHAKVAHPLLRKLNAFAEGNIASGGSGPNGTHTFDNLYPTNHPFYGIADLQGWKNMEEVVLGLSYKPLPKLLIGGSFHRFWLYNASDSWYAASGAVNVGPHGLYTDPTGKSGTSVGQEWDLAATYVPNQYWNFSAGVAYFQPGSYIGNLGGNPRGSQTWFYVQTEVKF